MNFNQKPGIYSLKDDYLIADFDELIKDSSAIINTDSEGTWLNSFDVHCKNNLKPFYLILPDDIELISQTCFVGYDNLIGISGKNVKTTVYKAITNCKNLKVIDFPNLIDIDGRSFPNCEELEEEYTNEDGLFIMGNCLISAKEYRNKNLTVPDNVKAIAFDAFANNKNLRELVLPANLTICELQFDVFPDKIILPINFERLRLEDFGGNIAPYADIYYKGSEENLKRISKSTEIEEKLINSIIIEPYTINELKELNFSTEQIEQIFNRQLTIDELLDFGKSYKEINNYIKNVER